MITDDQLYSLAVFLGSLSMLLIVLYHFLEVNAKEDDGGKPAEELSKERKADMGMTDSSATPKKSER